MKKTRAQEFLRKALFMTAMFSFAFMFASCDDDDVKPQAEEPVASFQYEISEENYLVVSFENFSQNAESYSWDFGDGETSTEENPTHTYAEAGPYTVVLTASNADGETHAKTEEITITDPMAAAMLLTGGESKTWKLYREGVSMFMDPDWTGLSNDGSRPCLYKQTWTFNSDGTYEFDDQGFFWAEYGLFNNVEGCDDHVIPESCFEAIPENMINACGDDVSAWLSATHSFEYDAAEGTLTLSGEGAWIGIPKLGSSGEVKIPQQSVTADVSITEETGFDLMTVNFNYGDITWEIVYVSYDDWANEPAVVEEATPFGEDLEDIAPSEIFLTFASKDAADVAVIDTVASGSSVAFGVDDPTDATAAKVGEFTRTAGVQYQELQMKAAPEPKDIQFDNFTSAKIDIFIPVGTEFAEGGLQKHIVFGFADQSQTEEWWNSPVQFVTEGDNVVVGEWTTYTFDLTDVKARQDLDMIFLGIGGGGHEAGGTFYVRNLTFE